MAVDLYKDILTPLWLKETFLLGIDLRDNDGVEFPARIFSESIRRAVGLVEKDFGIAVEPRVIEGERHSFDWRKKERYFPFALDVCPLLQLNEMQLQLGAFDPVNFPKEMALVTSLVGGRISIVPAPIPISMGPMSASTAFFMIPNAPTQEYMPGFFRFDYDAGMALFDGRQNVTPATTWPIQVDLPYALDESNYELTFIVTAADDDTDRTIEFGTVRRTQSYFTFEPDRDMQGTTMTVRWILSSLGADMKGYIGKYASTLVAAVAGDLLGGQGIASSSQSQDNVSQVVATTSSPENHGYSARVRQFERELKREREILRSYWSGLRTFYI